MEKKSKVNNDNFILIQGFMLSDLKLKGNELLIYAIIHGFSHLEGQRFNGGLQYLSDWTSSTKQGVMNCLKSLELKGLIKKDEKIIQGVKFCEYHTTKFTTPYNKVYHPHATEFTTPIQQSLPNSIDKSIEENILKNKEEISKEILSSDLENEKLRLEIERLNKALEEKNKERKTSAKKKESFEPPTVEEVEQYFQDNGYKIEVGTRAFNYYSVANWKDSKGSQVRSWKQKMQSVWFKEENKQNGKSNNNNEQFANFEPKSFGYNGNGQKSKSRLIILGPEDLPDVSNGR
jgi:regulator of replication initiation timing